MKSLLPLLTLVFGLVAATGALAAERTITLSIPTMDCAACPYIVEQTVGKLNGVKAIEATLESRTAVVTFDDAVTSVDAIIKASLDIGYEAILVEPAS